MPSRILVASYAHSVYSLAFDASAATLTTHSAVEVGFHPSWVEFHPSDHSLVFAGLEQTEGKIVAIKYDESGTGTVVAEAPSGGADPCSLLATENQLLVANYSSGSLSVLPITSGTAPYFLPGAVVVELHGSGPNHERQQSSHAHQVALYNQELLVADLGGDSVYRFAEQEGAWRVQGQIRFDPGSGPRHTAVYGASNIVTETYWFNYLSIDGALYTLLELNSTLSKHRLPGLPAEPSLIAVKSTMFNPPTAPHDMLAAELLIPEPNSTFATPYAYVSNRNNPSEGGDTIAIFSIEGDALELVVEISTGLKHLRGMAFGGPDNKWLVAGGAMGGGVKVFERIEGGKGLKVVATNSSVEAPTGFLWV
ncbi:Lactonase, 7-bladed beta-propeller-domain-containing protein [Mycena metata]|uniref:Lactonase, 7-bladed beta-propeller-domain-containing protein n=1 Tax=Mycena metata TaxID=1033252 RepID=A0AAD7NGV0_9AGAR|nr:Lactonase, 7-bladed beta-propeller-domain-containing protein [Mycena metata]